MHDARIDPTYLPATAPAPDGGVDVLGVIPVDGTDMCRPVDCQHPEAMTLRLTREQAHHLYRALGHTLRMTVVDLT